MVGADESRSVEIESHSPSVHSKDQSGPGLASTLASSSASASVSAFASDQPQASASTYLTPVQPFSSHSYQNPSSSLIPVSASSSVASAQPSPTDQPCPSSAHLSHPPPVPFQPSPLARGRCAPVMSRCKSSADEVASTPGNGLVSRALNGRGH